MLQVRWWNKVGLLLWEIADSDKLVKAIWMVDYIDSIVDAARAAGEKIQVSNNFQS